MKNAEMLTCGFQSWSTSTTFVAASHEQRQSASLGS